MRGSTSVAAAAPSFPAPPWPGILRARQRPSRAGRTAAGATPPRHPPTPSAGGRSRDLCLNRRRKSYLRVCVFIPSLCDRPRTGPGLSPFAADHLTTVSLSLSPQSSSSITSSISSGTSYSFSSSSSSSSSCFFLETSSFFFFSAGTASFSALRLSARDLLPRWYLSRSDN